MVSDMSSDRKLAEKHGVGKTKIAQIIKGKKNQFLIFETKGGQYVFEDIMLGWLFTILFLLIFLRLHSMSRESERDATRMTNPKEHTLEEVTIFSN